MTRGSLDRWQQRTNAWPITFCRLVYFQLRNMQSLSPDEYRDLSKRLEAAQGYLALGMHIDAWGELENIPAQHQALPEVLKIRVDACRFMKKWDIAAELSRHLALIEPEDPRHPVNLATAVRQIEGEQAALNILEQVRGIFPNDADILYNLACYRAVLGRVEEAKTLLAEAFTYDASLRITSLDDPDLVEVWDSFNAT
jgi:Flp pilus assembly protein TadD